LQAIQVSQTGDPEVLQAVEIARPEPGPEDLLVQVRAIGVNFIDVYHRTGLYPQKLPLIPGSELAGQIVEVGSAITDFKPGDRIATVAAVGAYAEFVRVPAQKAVLLPDSIADDVAAALMLQGMTAHYLAISTRPLDEGVTCLVHAAAGGVGLLLCQIAKMRGARVIGTTSTHAKADLAYMAGADEMILYGRQDVAAVVKELTDGKGVQVVYDSVGKATFEGSIASLAPRGMLVSFGQSSGAVPPQDPLLLSRSGSLYLTRPTLVHYTATREELLWRANDLFEWVGEGKLKVRIDRKVPLAKAADAHRALESRATSGKVLLVV
jgi:NADPH:quinone reductase